MFSRGPLPRGYKYAASIDVVELNSLYRSADLSGEAAVDEMTGSELEEELQTSLATIGVRDRDHRLVGIGVLTSEGQTAELANLAVHPDHQHLGIGKVLIRRRVEIADRLGMAEIEVRLISTNTLRPFYLELGFRAINEILLKRTA